MGYKSLFSPQSLSECWGKMEYNGKLEDVLESLRFKEGYNPSSPEHVSRVLLGGPRIIRGVLDGKIKQNSGNSVVDVVNAATEAALSVYSNPGSHVERLDNLVNTLERTGNSHLLYAPVVQGVDSVTLKAAQGHLSEESAHYFKEALGGGDALFLLVGHGGIMAGMDTFLKYKAATGSENSIAYPVRFSRDKMKDKTPQLDRDEIEYLRKVAEEKDVVVFDEDSYTGGTLRLFGNYLEKEICFHDDFVLKTNYRSSGNKDSKIA